MLLLGGNKDGIWSGEGWDPLQGRAFTPPDRSKKSGGLSREGERQWRWKRGREMTATHQIRKKQTQIREGR